MIDCRQCRTSFRTPPEKIGARCPKCKAPLFERPDKHPRVVELTACAVHPGVDAVETCQRCSKTMCAACRTRWHGEVLCPTCVELSISRAEPNPRELRKQANRAMWSLALAFIGWLLVLFALMLIVSRRQDALGWPIAFGLLSLVPALFAVGHGCPVLLSRGPRFQVAATGMITSGLHLGLLSGVLLVNLWHN